MCSRARHGGRSREGNTRGFGKSGAKEGSYLRFMGPGDPLKIVRIKLVVWNGKGEGRLKPLVYDGKAPRDLVI